jgi:hypothetical protein
MYAVGWGRGAVDRNPAMMGENRPWGSDWGGCVGWVVEDRGLAPHGSFVRTGGKHMPPVAWR